MARSVSQLKEEARRAEKREEWSRAIDLYREALRVSEESGDISLDLSLYNRIGDLYRRRGDTEEAVRFYRKAVQQYADQGLHTGAVALCNKILRLAPDHVDAYRMLGRLHASSGLAAEARNAFREYADRMRERGDAAAAQDADMELARTVGDIELFADVLGRMASSGRGEEARAALREVRDEQERGLDPSDPRLRELAEEMGVADEAADPGGTGGSEDDREDGRPEPTAPGDDVSGDRELSAGAPAPSEADDEAPVDGEDERREARHRADAADGDPEDAEGAEDDSEGVELEDILLHDPSTRRSAGSEPEPPPGSAAGDDSIPSDAEPEAPDPGAAPPGPESTASEPGAEAEARKGEPPEEARAGQVEEPVDLGRRIRRRLDAGGRQRERGVPAPGDFDEMLVGFRAEAAETSGEADPEAHVELGVALRQMGLVDDAVREFQVAARAPDPPVRAFELLGECFLEKDLHSVAVRVLNRALRLPGHADHDLLGVLYQLGVAYQTVEAYGEALDCFERVFSVDIDFRDVADRMETVRTRA